MKIKPILSSAIFIFLFISLPSHSLIVEGTFNGNVIFTGDGDPNFGYTPVWSGDIIGTKASGSFWYDTEKAPTNSASEPNSALYNSFTNNWLQITMSIDGKTFDISNASPKNHLSQDRESVWIYNHEQGVNLSNIEMFSISDLVAPESFSGDYIINGAIVEFYSYDYPVLKGIDIAQEFSWVDNGDPNFTAQAFFSVGGLTNGVKTAATAYVSITEFTVGIKNTVVPEPSSSALLAIGLLLLHWRYRSRKIN